MNGLAFRGVVRRNLIEWYGEGAVPPNKHLSSK